MSLFPEIQPRLVCDFPTLFRNCTEPYSNKVATSYAAWRVTLLSVGISVTALCLYRLVVVYHAGSLLQRTVYPFLMACSLFISLEGIDPYGYGGVMPRAVGALFRGFAAASLYGVCYAIVFIWILITQRSGDGWSFPLPLRVTGLSALGLTVLAVLGFAIIDGQLAKRDGYNFQLMQSFTMAALGIAGGVFFILSGISVNKRLNELSALREKRKKKRSRRNQLKRKGQTKKVVEKAPREWDPDQNKEVSALEEGTVSVRKRRGSIWQKINCMQKAFPEYHKAIRTIFLICLFFLMIISFQLYVGLSAAIRGSIPLEGWQSFSSCLQTGKPASQCSPLASYGSWFENIFIMLCLLGLLIGFWPLPDETSPKPISRRSNSPFFLFTPPASGSSSTSEDSSFEQMKRMKDKRWKNRSGDETDSDSDVEGADEYDEEGEDEERIPSEMRITNTSLQDFTHHKSYNKSTSTGATTMSSRATTATTSSHYNSELERSVALGLVSGNNDTQQSLLKRTQSYTEGLVKPPSSTMPVAPPALAPTNAAPYPAPTAHVGHPIGAKTVRATEVPKMKTLEGSNGSSSTTVGRASAPADSFHESHNMTNNYYKDLRYSDEVTSFFLQSKEDSSPVEYELYLPPPTRNTRSDNLCGSRVEEGDENSDSSGSGTEDEFTEEDTVGGSSVVLYMGESSAVESVFSDRPQISL